MSERRTTNLREVIDALERLYPPHAAASWDRVGLVSGDPDQPIERILLAVDPTLAVIDQARRTGADLIVVHHPLLLRGVHTIATTGAKGSALTDLVRAGIALYVAHTNADVAQPGVSDALAEAIGLIDLEPLAEAEGQWLGRVGSLPEPVRLADLAGAVAAAIPVGPGGVRVSGPTQALVQRVAVLNGAGDSEFDAVRRCGADVFVTADLRHHPALEAREEARAGPPYLVDAGHFASEWVWLPPLRVRLGAALAAAGATVEIDISDICTDPWDFVVGAVPPSTPGGTT